MVRLVIKIILMDVLLLKNVKILLIQINLANLFLLIKFLVFKDMNNVYLLIILTCSVLILIVQILIVFMNLEFAERRLAQILKLMNAFR